MLKTLATILFLTIFISSYGQGVELPVDYRQHNLTEYNPSLFNPAFLNRKNKHSVSLWNRWQWQTIDGDPTSIFVNYNGSISRNFGIGAGFIQHNTGAFLQTGGVVNLAYDISLGPNTNIAIGTNIFGFQQEFANDIFLPDPNIQLPQLEINNEFIVQIAPGIKLNIDKFTLGLTSENFVTLSSDESYSSDKIYLGHTSYDFPIEVFGDSISFIRPSIYIKSIPTYDTQVGLITLFSTSKFWAQTGYNNFYGFSVGGGAKLFKMFSLGALVEFGTDASIKDKDPSFEIVSAFSFGKPDERKKVVDFDIEEEEDVLPEIEEILKEKEEIVDSTAILEQKKLDSISTIRKQEIVIEEQKKQDSIALAKETEARVAMQKEIEQKKSDSINKVKLVQTRAAKRKAAKRKAELDRIAALKELEQKKQDSINTVRLAELDRIAKQKALEQKLRDSIAAVRLAQVDKAKENDMATLEENKAKTRGHYEEAISENNQQPGYYLIANVYRTKIYFEKFMRTLEDKGLEPKSFYRSINKYNYVYLKRYNTIEEAEQARISKFNGKYPDRTWIFRIK